MSNEMRRELSNLFNNPSASSSSSFYPPPGGINSGLPSPSAHAHAGAGGGGQLQQQQQQRDVHHLRRLENFYRNVDPDRVDTAEITLRHWKGNEEQFFRRLEKKYGVRESELPGYPGGGDSTSGVSPPPPLPNYVSSPSRHQHGQPSPSHPSGGGGGLQGVASGMMAARRISPSRQSSAQNTNFQPNQSGAGGSYAYASRSANGMTRFGDTNYRGRLLRFYALWAPERIKTVNKVLDVFKGREENLFTSLTNKFGPEPDAHFPVPDDLVPKEEEEQDAFAFVSSTNISPNAQAAASSSAAGVGGDGRRLGSAGADLSVAGSGLAALTMLQMEQEDADAQPKRVRGEPSKFTTGGGSGGSDTYDDGGKKQQQGSFTEPAIDWDQVCDCSSCKDMICSLDSAMMRKIACWFFPVCLICAIIGAIVTALVLVGVDRNLAAFKQTKSSSELDTSTLYGPGLYTWGINTRAIEFPTTLKLVNVAKSVSCCGGQSISLSETFFWTIADRQNGFVNKTGLAELVHRFGSIPVGQIVEVARESISDTIAAWSLNMSLDEFISNRTAIADVVHQHLQAALLGNRITVFVPREFFALGYIGTPGQYQSQKNAVFENNQTTITAQFTADAASYRLETTQKIRDLDANTSLILATASSNSTRMRSVARATNAALRLSNIAKAVANMSQRVNAQTTEAAIELFRLNEILDILESHEDSRMFVGNPEELKQILPLV